MADDEADAAAAPDALWQEVGDPSKPLEDKLETLLDQADANGDGQIDFDEFKSIVIEHLKYRLQEVSHSLRARLSGACCICTNSAHTFRMTIISLVFPIAWWTLSLYTIYMYPMILTQAVGLRLIAKGPGPDGEEHDETGEAGVQAVQEVRQGQVALARQRGAEALHPQADQGGRRGGPGRGEPEARLRHVRVTSSPVIMTSFPRHIIVSCNAFARTLSKWWKFHIGYALSWLLNAVHSPISVYFPMCTYMIPQWGRFMGIVI